MNIHEYQAKAVLKEFGVPVPRGSRSGAGARGRRGGTRRAHLVVKSQIHAGGRGKGKFKENEAGGKAACGWQNRSPR